MRKREQEHGYIETSGRPIETIRANEAKSLVRYYSTGVSWLNTIDDAPERMSARRSAFEVLHAAVGP
jgi:hypothetical protein